MLALEREQRALLDQAVHLLLHLAARVLRAVLRPLLQRRRRAPARLPQVRVSVRVRVRVRVRIGLGPACPRLAGSKAPPLPAAALYPAARTAVIGRFSLASPAWPVPMRVASCGWPARGAMPPPRIDAVPGRGQGQGRLGVRLATGNSVRAGRRVRAGDRARAGVWARSGVGVRAGVGVRTGVWVRAGFGSGLGLQAQRRAWRAHHAARPRGWPRRLRRVRARIVVEARARPRARGSLAPVFGLGLGPTSKGAGVPEAAARS